MFSCFGFYAKRNTGVSIEVLAVGTGGTWNADDTKTYAWFSGGGVSCSEHALIFLYGFSRGKKEGRGKILKASTCTCYMHHYIHQHACTRGLLQERKMMQRVRQKERKRKRRQGERKYGSEGGMERNRAMRLR